MIDIKQVASDAHHHIFALVQSWFKGELRGRNFIAIDPTYNDSNLGSFQINIETGVWKNFSNGQGGNDMVSLYAYANRVKMKEAAEEVARQIGSSDFKPVEAPKQTGGNWIPERTAPVAPTARDLRKWLGKDDQGNHLWKESTRSWIYRNQDGNILFATARFEFEDGSKDVLPFCWCKNSENGNSKWKNRGYPEPRPLYGLDRINKQPVKILLIVEGEKCADAAQEILGETFAVISWPGGGKAVGKAFWSSIKGRKKLLWPDNDKPGFIAAQDILATDATDNFKVVLPPWDKPKGWDVADAIEEGWDRDRIVSALKAAVPPHEFLQIDPDIRFRELLQSPQQDLTEQQSLQMGDGDAPLDGPLPPDDGMASADLDGPECPFRILGYNRTSYYFYSYSTRQMVELSPSEITDSNVLRLATLQWWEKNFPSKNGMDTKSARNALIQIAHSKGIFDPDYIRGPGAWIDGEQVVVHQGDHLLISNERVELQDFRSRYIYEADISNGDEDNIHPLPTNEANKIMEIMGQLSWERPEYGRYLAGWIVCAIVSGTLKWRPHVFVTGGAGTGKSYVMNTIVRRILGRSVTQLMGDSSAAGMRQALENRAWPVWVDEFEGESAEQMRNIESVFSLLRCASTDTDASIVKGTKDGTARKYKIRCCAIMSGIGMNITKHADVTRFSVLTLKKSQGDERERMEHFTGLDRMVHNTLTEEWCSAFRSRAINLAKVIRQNAKTFSQAAGEILGARLGDQIGALLAGSYACYSNGLIQLEDARKWVEKQDWSEQDETKADPDELRCLKAILMQMLQVGGRGVQTRTISELVDLAMSCAPADDFFDANTSISASEARLALERIGIKPDREGISISCTSRELSRFLRETPWSLNWGSQLKRLEGAKFTTTRFTEISQKSVHVPRRHYRKEQ